MRRCGQLDRLAQHIQDPLGDQLGGGVQPDGVDQHHELVAAEATDRVAVAQDGLQPRPDLAQDLVSGLMAEPVVDLLEAVDVHEQRGDRHVQPPRSGEHLLGAVEDQAPVRQVGQRIVQRAVLQLVGLLPDQAPGPLARTRERAIEQEDRNVTSRPTPGRSRP